MTLGNRVRAFLNPPEVPERPKTVYYLRKRKSAKTGKWQRLPPVKEVVWKTPRGSATRSKSDKVKETPITKYDDWGWNGVGEKTRAAKAGSNDDASPGANNAWGGANDHARGGGKSNAGGGDNDGAWGGGNVDAPGGGNADAWGGGESNAWGGGNDDAWDCGMIYGWGGESDNARGRGNANAWGGGNNSAWSGGNGYTQGGGNGNTWGGGKRNAWGGGGEDASVGRNGDASAGGNDDARGVGSDNARGRGNADASGGGNHNTWGGEKTNIRGGGNGSASSARSFPANYPRPDDVTSRDDAGSSDIRAFVVDCVWTSDDNRRLQELYSAHGCRWDEMFGLLERFIPRDLREMVRNVRIGNEPRTDPPRAPRNASRAADAARTPDRRDRRKPTHGGAAKRPSRATGLEDDQFELRRNVWSTVEDAEDSATN